VAGAAAIIAKVVCPATFLFGVGEGATGVALVGGLGMVSSRVIRLAVGRILGGKGGRVAFAVLARLLEQTLIEGDDLVD